MAQNLDTVTAVKKKDSEVVAPADVVTPVTAVEIPTTEAPAAPTAESNESYDAMFPEPTVSITPPPTWIIWALLMGLSLAAIGLGYAYLSPRLDTYLAVTPLPSASPTDVASTISPTPTKSASSEASPSASATAAAAPNATTTPTASGTVTKPSAVTLRVLNGTKTTGAAASASTLLEKGGYAVRTVGNAKNQSYAQTTVYYQAGKKAEAEDVAKTISSKYSPQLEESTLASPDMVLVVVGVK